MYILKRDGKAIIIGTESECWTWILRHTPFSTAWAVRHEGYSVEEVLTKGKVALKQTKMLFKAIYSELISDKYPDLTDKDIYLIADKVVKQYKDNLK